MNNSSHLMPRNVFLAGLLFGVLTAGIGHMLYVGHGELRQLVKKCIDESAAGQRATQGCKSDDPSCHWRQSPMVCGPDELVQLIDLEQATNNIQGQIKSKALGVTSRSTSVHALALAFVILGALPAIWYFLLARVREVGDAIRGK